VAALRLALAVRARLNRPDLANAMSRKHPIIAVTGSSGAGTSTVKRTFETIFRREGITAATIEGDAFHRYERKEMKERIAAAEREGRQMSHFGPEANEWVELEKQFGNYARDGRCRTRLYLHNEAEAAPWNQEPGTFTPWHDTPVDTDLLFYEGLHGCVKTAEVDLARRVDLKIGVVPIINLEWIQKIHRDTKDRGYSKEAVADTILRRMHDYIHEPVHRPRHPDRGREHDGDPLQEPARHRLPLPAVDDRRIVHVARQHDRGTGREDGPGDAADPHADDPAPDGDPARATRLSNV